MAAGGRALLTVAAVLLGVEGSTAAANAPGPAWSEYFRDFAACALVETRDRFDEKHLEYRPPQCALLLSPCSTFKIPHALIGLQTGVVAGPETTKAWDGKVRSRQALNRDHDLASAMRHSVVWYFREMARDIGSTRMQVWLDRLGYGNRDLSGGIDRFWLDDSLTLSAYDQFELIKGLWRGGLPFDTKVQAQVREMLRQQSPLPGQLFGKTGSCKGASKADAHGWFVGWIEWNHRREHNPATSWFVVNLIGANADGRTARAMTIELLRDLEPR